VSIFQTQYASGSLRLPALGLWLDPHDPQADLVFVSHAHSDHIAEHREVILSEPTSRLMQSRLPGQRREHVLPFHQPRRFQIAEQPFDITLLPAGHIFGSAMSFIHCEQQSLLYTGDFKLRPGLSAETCEPRQADILVMETTYGRAHYRFPPTAGVMQGIIRFCREALDNDETPVLLGYSLGKSQELLCGLGDAGLPLMLHGTVFKLTQIYEQFGQCFPPYERYEAGAARGKVLLCPPHVIHSAMLRNLGKSRTAILTGWAVDSNCRYRYQCDAAFPLSDHADYGDLLELVKQVQPRKVYTLHGFAADFAQSLRELGIEAHALSQEEQFLLPLDQAARQVRSPRPKEKRPRTQNAAAPIEAAGTADGPLANSAPSSFHDFARTCSLIAADARKLEKIRLLAEYLRGLNPAAVAFAATWFSGRPFSASQNKVLQLGWAVLRDAMTAFSGVEEAALHQIYLKHSDLGETVAELLTREIVPTLSIEQVAELFDKLQAARGPLAKTPLLSDALERASALEGKYLVKIITGDLRIGLKEGLVEEAVASAFGQPPEVVRQANLLLGDIGETARLASLDRLADAAMVPFRPIKFMLASPEPTAAEVWNRMHTAVPAGDTLENQEAASKAAAGGARFPVWVEDKYDGVRCQLHKVGLKVALYSRDLKEITNTFLEVADAARKLPADFILDGEILAMRGEEVLPFASLQRRLGRRQGDLFMGEEVPIQFVAFDLLWSNEESLLNRPLRERRTRLEALKLSAPFRLARITPAHSAEEIDSIFDAARERNNEGLMIKDPLSVYAPGRRGLAWVKLKKAFATLDCVVVGAEYGHGKRSKVLSDYTFAVRDETSGELKTIGKAYSGLTDVEIERLTQHFFQTALRQRGRYFEVRPETVLEIAFDRIAPSERHNSGLAMRFPRIVRIRTDKNVNEIDTLATARKLAAG
jgi:DNA ligase-1